VRDCLSRDAFVDPIAGLQVDVDRLVTTANLDDFPVKRARLLDRPKFFFHTARPARELNQIRFTPDNAAHRVVLGELVLDLLVCFSNGLRSSTIEDLIDLLVDFATGNFFHTGSNAQTP
jgi:hypothetical protein